jgi:hypothetical protein
MVKKMESLVERIYHDQNKQKWLKEDNSVRGTKYSNRRRGEITDNVIEENNGKSKLHMVRK